MLQRLITTIRQILFSLANNSPSFPTTIISLHTVHRNLNSPNLVLFGCFPISNQTISWNTHQNNHSLCIQYLHVHEQYKVALFWFSWTTGTYQWSHKHSSTQFLSDNLSLHVILFALQQRLSKLYSRVIQATKSVVMTTSYIHMPDWWD